MAEIAIGGAVGEGFGLIRRRPLTVFSWGLVQIAIAALGVALLLPMYGLLFGSMVQQFRTGAPGAVPNLAGMGQAQSISSLINLVSLLVGAVINCAVFRSVLHPEQSRFAYLRIGVPELLLAMLLFAGVIAAVLGIFAALLVVGIVVGILVAIHVVAAAVIVGVAGGVVVLIAAIYVGLRLSFVGPMMVDEGQLRLGEAWALTRGKVGSLFAVGLLLFLILIGGEIVLGLVIVAVGLGALGTMAGGFQSLPTLLQQSPALLIGKLAPMFVVAAVLWIPLAGCVQAIVGAPWARAYRDLRPKGDIAATFA